MTETQEAPAFCPLKRGDFVLVRTTSAIAYLRGDPRTYEHFRFYRVRGVDSNGTVTSYFDWNDEPHRMPDRGVQTWGIPVASVSQVAFWTAIRGRRDNAFTSLAEAVRFARRYARRQASVERRKLPDRSDK